MYFIENFLLIKSVKKAILCRIAYVQNRNIYLLRCLRIKSMNLIQKKFNHKTLTLCNPEVVSKRFPGPAQNVLVLAHCSEGKDRTSCLVKWWILVNRTISNKGNNTERNMFILRAVFFKRGLKRVSFFFSKKTFFMVFFDTVEIYEHEWIWKWF